MARSLVAFALLARLAQAGLNFADPALLVNQAKAGQVDLRTNGLVAHVCLGGLGGQVKVDLKRVSDDEKIRLAMDPPLTKGDLILQQIPPGRYVATHLLLCDRDPMRFGSDTFEVRAGSITTLGKVRLAMTTNLLGQLTRFDLATDSLDLRSRIQALRMKRLDTMPVQPTPIHWMAEPGVDPTAKRLLQ